MKRLLFISVIWSIASVVCAQEKQLQQVISVDFRNTTMYEALLQIEGKAGIYFSYDNQFIKNQKRISFAVNEKPVKTILDMILDREYYYIINNNRVIIRRKEQQYQTIEGRLTDAETGAPLEYASVYAPEVQVGAISDAKGYFQLRVLKSDALILNASRVSYYDTSFTINDASQKNITIPMSKRIISEAEVVLTSVQRNWLARRLIGTKRMVNSVNLKNYFYQRKFQLGILPGIATKNGLKGQQENHLSFNVLGGYAAQVDAFELGGLFNVVQKHVRSVQIGGLANVVGGTVSGVQIGGMYNDVGDTVRGIQIGGIVNANKSAASGFQISGIYNKNAHFDGLQIAGISNRSAVVDKGVQIAGITNISTRINKGLQLSGVLNRAGCISGMQLAGLVNYAKSIKGVQLGLVNIGDSINGTAIGPFNYHKNGKHSLAVSMNENGQAMLSYKSGTNRFYNIFQAGWMHASEHMNYYLLGYGWGTEWPVHQKIKIATELTSAFYTPSEKFVFDYNNVNFQPLFIYNLSEKLQLFAGPRVQYQLPVNDPENPVYNGFRRNMILLNSSKKNALSLGFTVGFSIF